jgi:hypothetical protein
LKIFNQRCSRIVPVSQTRISDAFLVMRDMPQQALAVAGLRIGRRLGWGGLLLPAVRRARTLRTAIETICSFELERVSRLSEGSGIKKPLADHRRTGLYTALNRMSLYGFTATTRSLVRVDVLRPSESERIPER